MAKKKRAGKNTSRRKATTRKKPGKKDKKFHGLIEVTPPEEGQAISDKTRILVALRSIAIGDLPGPGQNQLSLVVTAETDKESEGQVSGSLKVDLLKYVKDHEALNIRDLVIFSGPVHRHLTLRCSIDELDESSIESTKKLIRAVLDLGKELVGGGTTTTLFGGLPALFGAMLSFNKDDQILVLNHSFYTKNVNAPGTDRALRSGLYTFRKLRTPSAKPQVTLQVEVLTVS